MHIATGLNLPAGDVFSSLYQAATDHADAVAARTLTADGTQISAEMTWGELCRDVQLLSRRMMQELPLKTGDRLGVLGRNSVELIQIMYACADAGIIFVPLNNRWSTPELQHALRDCDIKVMAILDHDFLDSVVKTTGGHNSSLGITHILTSQKAWSRGFSSEEISNAARWRMISVGAVTPRLQATDYAGIQSMRLSLSCEESPGETASPGTGDMGIEPDELDHNAGNASRVGSLERESMRYRGLSLAGTSDVFCIVHTSGTTGVSKGVALTHIGQMHQAVAKCKHIGYTSSTTYLNILPLFHVGGISSALAITAVAGCHVFLPHFTSAAGAAAIEAGRVNALVVVPTMLHMLVNARSSGKSSPSPREGLMIFETVDTVVVGGQRVPRGLERQARISMPNAAFVQTYACTEAGSTMTFAFSFRSASAGASSSVLRGKDERDHAGGDEDAFDAGGVAAEGIEIRVVDRESRECACLSPVGAIGEIETRGPHVMKGYWGKPELTAQVLRPDGWLRTGDLGRLDELTHRLVVVGRAKDTIKTGGESVHASEVEGVLLRHTWVAEAVAYGVRDERLGEKVAASVVLDTAVQERGGAISRGKARAVLSEFCSLHLSRYKCPRRIDLVPALPKSSSGKVLRHALRSSL